MQEFQKIHEGKNSIIFKGFHKDFENEVIIKEQNAEFSDKIIDDRFENEFLQTKNLKIKGINKALKKEKKNNRTVLVLEYFNGLTLKKFISENNTEFSKLLKIAIELAQTIGEIHEHSIIHKDINTNNIIVNNEHETKIIDFGLATKYTLKTTSNTNPNQLVGTLQYISPEQTGRMNKKVDYRTDLYSFGIVLYEMFAKKLPFDDLDKMELIHSHIAKMPQQPQPPSIECCTSKSWDALWLIILKLLSKNAEDRYQSAFGVKNDLQKIIKIQAGENIKFTVGENDFSGKLINPDKLYGREDAINKLHEAFEKVSNGKTELYTIYGQPGVGKSALIQEVNKPITINQNIFVEGKFDQFHKNIPYTAIISAFRNFANNILNKSDDELDYWKNLMQKSVGDVGKVLTNLIPELELIIGKQSDLTELEGKEAQNRFEYVWRNFIKSIAKAEHPFVIFLDDLQWADNSSIELLQLLLSDTEIQYFFCILAYRENEISPDVISDLKNISDLKMSALKLSNLTANDVNNLVCDSIGIESNEKVEELSSLIYSKTLGNAFFTIQFLTALYEEELVKFDFKTNTWNWDIAKIKQLNITDNVIDLLTVKIKKLPEQTRYILKIASCIGHNFSLDILSIIYKKDEENVEKGLEPALIENLIEPENNKFKFVHDRIRQAVYSTISEGEKALYHLETGRLLLKFLSKKQLDNKIFDVVNQFNLGKELISEASEIKKLTALNLRAGIKAKSASAFLPAYNYLHIALNLLEPNSWQSFYDISLKIHEEAAEICYLTGRYDETKKLAEIIIKNAKEILDTINIYSILTNSYTSQSEYHKAIDISTEVIAKLGLKLPNKPTQLGLAKEFIHTQLAIGRKKAQDFSKLPQMTDKTQLAIIKLINSIGSAVYLAKIDLFPFIIFKSVRIYLKYGNCKNSAFTYSGYGIVLSVMNNFNKAVEFATLGRELIKKLQSEADRAKINFTLNAFGMLWRNPLHEIVPEITKTYKFGVEAGDLEYASYGLMNLTLQLYTNTPLQKVQDYAIKNIEVIRKLKQRYSLLHLLGYVQMIDILINETEKPTKIIGKYLNEDEELEAVLKNKNFSFLSVLYVNKLYLHLIFNDLTGSEQVISLIEEHKEINRGSFYFSLNNFYRSLIYIRYYEKTKDRKFIKKVVKNQKFMQLLAKNNTENFLHKYELVEAEKYRVLGKFDKAKKYYDKAITSANKGQIINEEALSWELYGRFYLQISNEVLAKFYLQNAYKTYKIWGATTKLKHLENEFPHFTFEKQNISATSQSTTMTTSTENSTALLDITTIVKASQSLSGEVKLDNLLSRMLMLIMENAGADYAVIIKNNEGKYTIEAKGEIGKKFEILQSESLENTSDISQSIVRYVVRTGKHVVVDDAISDNKFSADAYIQYKKVKSIFCYPVIHKNKLVAVLYLENNLSTHVFTLKQIETINILSSQIAVSIENALLYDNLENKVEERTKELKATVELVNHQKDEIETQKTVVEISHKKITDSINYAKKIQDAILPSNEFFKNNFTDYFILFKPRDVVSGDFYWAKKVNNYLVFSVADCTGHGVPGAFVSMLGIAFLNEIVRRKEIVTASDVLEHLRKEVKTSLQQSTGTQNKDGMDIALCIIDTETNKLQYSGAYNPLLIFKSGEPKRKLISFSPNRQPIGIHINEHKFTNHTFQLSKGDNLYLFSDGYADQLGGKRGSKFYIKYFKELLAKIQNEDMKNQKELLSKNFIEWKGKNKQLDDVLVIGVKI